MTAQAVFFRPVYCELTYVSGIGLPRAPGPLSQGSCSSDTVTDYASTPRASDTSTATVLLPAINRDARFVLGPADLTSSDLLGAWVEPSGSGFAAVVGFTTPGSSRYQVVAAARYGVYQQAPSDPRAQEAIDVNGEVVSFGPITSADEGSCVEIVGSGGRGLSRTDASNLVAELRGAAHLLSQPSTPQCAGNRSGFVLAGVSPSAPAMTA